MRGRGTERVHTMHEREIRRRIEAHPVEAPPAAMRAAFEALADLPVDERGCTIERRPVGEVEVDVVVPPDGPGAATLVHLHGGGYVFGSARTHRRLGIELAVASGCELWLPDYPLAPERRWPAQRRSAAELVRAAISADGVRPDRPLVLCGDSAGGHLALATLLSGEPGLTAVAGVVLFSPNTLRDYTLTRTRTGNADADVMNDHAQDHELARTAFGDGDPADPERTLVNAPLDALPAIYLDVGGDEILLDDALVFAREAALAGVAVELKVRPGVFHMSQLFAQHWGVADASLRDAGAWVARLVA